MKSLGFGRVTLCSCVAAAMLAGCGGAQSIAADGAISQNFVDLTQTRASSKSLRHTSVTERVLYSFNGKPDGQEPMGALLDVNGTLYGTTSAGGTINAGTVFAINNGVETIILDFNGSQGASPMAGLIKGDGKFYGTAFYGGNAPPYGCGCGLVFSITPSGVEQVLHYFGGADGSAPTTPPIKIGNTLYGITTEGGAGLGNLYKVALRSNKETSLYSFNEKDGAIPESLVEVKRKFYGVTYQGGATAQGTVFEITKSGKETVLHSFSGPKADGSYPWGSLTNVGGVLYGTTGDGGTGNYGTVFKITPSGQESVLHSFAGTPDGMFPFTGLLNVNGTLYGTTPGGGANGYGTFFSITTSGTENVLYSFGAPPDGNTPDGNLIYVDGTFFGVTLRGGSSDFSGCDKGCGTVFSVSY
ncbi:MAG: choice-of-anchor tandem repeat GloVer-containing protein [Candidatus Cybelea sp.]|jgi:uncharacterized repeat protein (TIGR03803 family)